MVQSTPLVSLPLMLEVRAEKSQSRNVLTHFPPGAVLGGAQVLEGFPVTRVLVEDGKVGTGVKA